MQKQFINSLNNFLTSLIYFTGIQNTTPGLGLNYVKLLTHVFVSVNAIMKRIICQFFGFFFRPDVTFISLYQTHISMLHYNQIKQIEPKTKTRSSARHVFYFCLLEPWFDMYLKSRLPIVLNYNPFISFQDDPRPEYQNQVS